VRRTEFWRRMRQHFGDSYAESLAHDYVIAALGGRTVAEALAAGEDARTVWRAVCDAMGLPTSAR
jgi:predicted metalloprotease